MDNTILYTAKFTHHELKFHKVGGNRTKDLEVGPDRQTKRQTCRETDMQRDRQTHTQTDRHSDSYIHPKNYVWGYKEQFLIVFDQTIKIDAT